MLTEDRVQKLRTYRMCEYISIYVYSVNILLKHEDLKYKTLQNYLNKVLSNNICVYSRDHFIPEMLKLLQTI